MPIPLLSQQWQLTVTEGLPDHASICVCVAPPPIKYFVPLAGGGKHELQLFRFCVLLSYNARKPFFIKTRRDYFRMVPSRPTMSSHTVDSVLNSLLYSVPFLSGDSTKAIRAGIAPSSTHNGKLLVMILHTMN